MGFPIPSKMPDKVQNSSQSTVKAQQQKQSVVNKLRDGATSSGTRIQAPEPKSETVGNNVDYLA